MSSRTKPVRTTSLLHISAILAKASYMKMSEMRTAKLSSVNRVMYRTSALRSKATMTSSATMTQIPIQNRKDMKCSPFSLHGSVTPVYICILIAIMIA